MVVRNCLVLWPCIIDIHQSRNLIKSQEVFLDTLIYFEVDLSKTEEEEVINSFEC